MATYALFLEEGWSMDDTVIDKLSTHASIREAQFAALADARTKTKAEELTFTPSYCGTRLQTETIPQTNKWAAPISYHIRRILDDEDLA